MRMSFRCKSDIQLIRIVSDTFSDRSTFQMDKVIKISSWVKTIVGNVITQRKITIRWNIHYVHVNGLMWVYRTAMFWWWWWCGHHQISQLSIAEPFNRIQWTRNFSIGWLSIELTNENVQPNGNVNNHRKWFALMITKTWTVKKFSSKLHFFHINHH